MRRELRAAALIAFTGSLFVALALTCAAEAVIACDVFDALYLAGCAGFMGGMMFVVILNTLFSARRR